MRAQFSLHYFPSYILYLLSSTTSRCSYLYDTPKVFLLWVLQYVYALIYLCALVYSHGRIVASCLPTYPRSRHRQAPVLLVKPHTRAYGTRRPPMGPRHWVPVPGLAQDRVWPKAPAAQRLLPPIRFWPPRRTFRTIGALFHARFYNPPTPGDAFDRCP